MQYLLSESEYNGLLQKKLALEKADKEELQKLCTKIACTMPIKMSYMSEPGPWGCPKSDDGDGMEYCDECPVQTICPNDYKSWSQ